VKQKLQARRRVLEHGGGGEELVRHVQVPAGRRKRPLLLLYRHPRRGALLPSPSASGVTPAVET
jgi:hypothetical protein